MKGKAKVFRIERQDYEDGDYELEIEPGIVTEFCHVQFEAITGQSLEEGTDAIFKLVRVKPKKARRKK